MALPPTDRLRELDTLLAKIRGAAMVQLNHDMWDHWGSAQASPEQRATMDADLADASQALIAARTALDALVATMRAEAPADIAAWIEAHDDYLGLFPRDP